MQNKKPDSSRAQRLVQETLEASFNKNRFSLLIKNILNRIDEREEVCFSQSGRYIFASHHGFIRRYERIGKYKGPDGKEIDILIVYLSKDDSLERARSKQRNFVARYLNGSRGGKLRDAALVAFVPPERKDWRFSLVKIDYKLDEEGRAEQNLTPARRYSFLVGENEKSHTAQSRLLPIYQNEEGPTLKELEEAFSVEKVTKDFFQQYQRLYLLTKDSLESALKDNAEARKDFEEKGIDTSDFAKKLLGQIAFLYFIQKKGWLGVAQDGEWGTGSKYFLRELFEKKHIEYENFFNDILEPLFYEALREKQTDDYYQRFGCRIPFLNGGLFDPLENYSWLGIDIQLPNDIFSNNEKTKDGDIGDGILDVFDRYNFTVKEDEPLEKEVAVDPEMLGKVFESLLEVKERKSKGTYYTPREIVHYMCQESLVNYLDTALDSKIKKEDIKTLVMHSDTILENDNRVVREGRETERYSFKMPEAIREKANLIDKRLEEVRICDPAIGSGAFIVGMMSEIVAIRNVLTIYIQGNGQEDTDRIPCHFKRYAIQNCLYGVDVDLGAVEIAKLRLWLSLVVDEEERQSVRPLPNLDYKIVQGNALLSIDNSLFNDEQLKKLELLKTAYFNETDFSTKQKYQEDINKCISDLTNEHKKFDFRVYFSEVFRDKQGFDVVIANPPYVDYRSIDPGIRKALSHFKSNGSSLKPNLFIYFIERGIRITKANGILTFINPNTFLSSDVAFPLRKFTLENTAIEFIIDVSHIAVFEGVNVYPVVWLCKKDSSSNEAIRVNKCNELKDLGATTFRIPKINIASDSSLIIPTYQDFELVTKIEGQHTKLEKFCTMQWGTSKSGCNKHVISSRKYTELPKEQQREYEPFIETASVRDYCIDWKGNYIQDEGIFSDNVKLIFGLESKILVARLATRLRCAIDSQKRYIGKVSILFNFERIEEQYLLALLNSSLINYWYSRKFESLHMAGGYLRFDIPYLKRIPIVQAEGKHLKRILSISNEILAITKESNYSKNDTKQSEVLKHKKRIDQLVYQLYDLTSEEIKKIENATKE